MYKLYQMPDTHKVLQHFPLPQTCVRDQAEDSELLMHARVRSGDYFETIASELERIAESLALQNDVNLPDLERIIGELVQANRSYRVVSK